jgi:ELWxxDGT repeat protein
LWRSDGTPTGTTRIFDFVAGSEGPYELFADGGTVGSTRLLADLVPGAAGSGVSTIVPAVTSAGSFFYLGVGNLGFWNAGAGTAIPLANDLQSVDVLGVTGDRLFFDAELAGGWRSDELWSSDGTPAGTGPVLDIWPGESGSSIVDPAILDARLYFRACSPPTGCELWTSDGTPAGTHLVVDLVPGPESSLPSALAAFEGRVYFAACRVADGCEPWITDGTAAGTHRVGDLAPGPASSLRAPAGALEYLFSTFELSGGRIFFPADDSAGVDLWAMPLEIFYDGFETGDRSRWNS